MTTPRPLSRHRARVAAVAAALREPAANTDRTTQRLAQLLRTLPPPTPPAALHAPEFFEAVLERAVAQASRSLGAATLRAAFGPSAASGDVVWLEPGESELAHALVDARPQTRAPGWLWGRIRAELFGGRPLASPRHLAMAAAAAAAVLLAVLSLRQGTSAPPELVFRQVDKPLSAAGHPSDFLRELGR